MKFYTKEKITLYVDTKSKITWSSANKKIATVTSKGVVTGVKPGNTTITATVGKKKYKCKIQVWSPEPEIMSVHDVAPADPVDRYSTADIDISSEKEAPSDRNLDGIETPTTEEDESSEYGKTPEWVDYYYLTDFYDISFSWTGTKSYLTKGDDNYIITGTPSGKFEAGKVYEGKYNDYIIRFKYENGILINFADLVTAGFIKIK